LQRHQRGFCFTTLHLNFNKKIISLLRNVIALCYPDA
jgi:hypothetical protein